MSTAPAFKRSAATAPTEIPMLIGGAWRAAAETYDVRDPYRGGVARLRLAWAGPDSAGAGERCTALLRGSHDPRSLAR